MKTALYSKMAQSLNYDTKSELYYNNKVSKIEKLEVNIACANGGLSGFQDEYTSKKSPSGFPMFTMKYSCTNGSSSDIVNASATPVAGTSKVTVPMNMPKKGGNGTVSVPIGNSCTCANGQVLSSLEFYTEATLKNHLGLRCKCRPVKDASKIECKKKDLPVINLDQNRCPVFAYRMYMYLNKLPVLAGSTGVLKSVTIGFNDKLLNCNTDYCANQITFSYEYCYNKSTPDSDTSGGKPSTTTISAADKELIVRVHNKLRNDVALQQTQYKTQLPKASNMRQVYWDEEIAKKAQDHANKKVFDHSSSSYRKTSVFSYLGENLYSSSSSGSSPVVEWERAIKRWYDEIASYPKSSSSVPKYSGSGTGHFSQVIWANSYAIGCGISAMSKSSLLYVCEYGPGGNYSNEAIYKPGNLSCPAGTSKSTEFAGLCCLPDKCTSKEYLLK